MKLEARDITIHYRRQRYGDHLLAVSAATLGVDQGEFVAIVGPSGCGKTSMLNAIDGLVPISGGKLLLDGRSIDRPGRDRAVVFQQPSLLPWRTVMGNVLYGIERDLTYFLRRAARSIVLGNGRYGMRSDALSHDAARERAKSHIELVGLAGFEDAFPSELSGGMQQRVNLARALATDPELLLLDEPFAALDALMRETMQQELLRIWSQTRKTAIFVTHDIVEAVYLADRVIVFTARPGRVKLNVKIDLPRPRDLRIKREPRFLEYELRIWESIREEVGADREHAPAHA